MRAFRIGNVTVQSVSEMDDTSFQLRTFFPTADDAGLVEVGEWLKPPFYDPATDALTLSIHAWLLDTGRSRILIDTCVGNDKERHARSQWTRLATPFLDRLAAAGARPEDIDYVLCTHLHADHVGWNTRLLDGRWVPTFPRAKYVFGRREYDYWAERYQGAKPDSHHLAAYVDSVLPVIEAGQVMIVDEGAVIDDVLTIEPAYGHTPGHVSVWLTSGSASAVFSGDVIHHPVQLRRPDWSCLGCQDPIRSAETRTALLRRLADTETELITGHFIAPHSGHVLAHGDAFGFRFRCEEA